MWDGIPGTVVRRVNGHEHYVLVDIGGIHRTIEIHQLRGQVLEPGDWIVVSRGRAERRIPQVEALAWLRLLVGVGLPLTDDPGGLDIPGIG